MKKEFNKIVYVIGVLASLTILAMLLSSLIPALKSDSRGNVALIAVNGEIVSEKPLSIFSPAGASSGEIIKLIERAERDSKIKGILFEINSGGGSAYATEEIVNAIKKVNKTKIAVIKEAGASGAYWIASSCDKIVASKLSIVGSIGVTSSYLEFSELMEKYGVGYERIVSGEYKDIGSPFRNLSREEQKILLEKIQLVHNYFLEEVAKKRGLTKEQEKEVASGMFYTGEEALNLSLIDMIGGRDEAVKLMEEKINVPAVIVEYKKTEGFFEKLFYAINRNMYYLGSGIGSALTAHQILGLNELKNSEEISIVT